MLVYLFIALIGQVIINNPMIIFITIVIKIITCFVETGSFDFFFWNNKTSVIY